MKKVFTNVLTVATALMVAITIFLSGYLIAQEETERRARVESVIRKGRWYRDIISDTPSERLDKSDKEELLEVLDGKTTEWWDCHYVVKYEFSYVDDRGESWYGICTGSIEGMMSNLSRCNWMDVTSIEPT